MIDANGQPWPINPDNGIPAEWEDALEKIERAPTIVPAHAAVQRARALMLLDEMRWQRHIFYAEAERRAREAGDAMMRHREALAASLEQAAAAQKHAKSVTKATWILAGSTVVLAVATVALIFATLNAA